MVFTHATAYSLHMLPSIAGKNTALHAAARACRRTALSSLWLYPIHCFGQMVSFRLRRETPGVRRKSGANPAFPLRSYGRYTAFTPVIRSLFSFFSGSLVRLAFISNVCSFPPFWKVPV